MPTPDETGKAKVLKALGFARDRQELEWGSGKPH